MRIYNQGFEGNNTGRDDFTNFSGGNAYLTDPHTDIKGNGGSYAYRNVAFNDYWRPNSTFQDMNGFTSNIRDVWIRFACKMGYEDFRYLPSVSLVETDLSTEILNIQLDKTFANLRSGINSTIQDTGTYTYIQDYVYHLVEIHMYLDSANGLVEVYYNGESTASYSFSGNTEISSTNPIGTVFVCAGHTMDDFVINTPTMLYDGGTGGAPSVGTTLTGGTGGETAIIEGYEGDATSGRLFLSIPSGAFADGEIVTDTGTFSATVNAPTADFVDGLEPQSGRPGEGFIVRLEPDGDSTIGLTGSDGDSVDNYLLITTVGTTDYVEATAAGLEDEYTLNTFTDLGFASGEVDVVNAIQSRSYASKDGVTINNIQHSVTTGGTTYYAHDSSLDAGYAYHYGIWSYNPDNDTNWTEANIDGLITGFKFNA